ncbi:hypothetical protein PR048_013481 [Dryococelus australis]|uniref:Uncharacterized protein n=1 Tax=Dryococelus australis TaxID=614101 RepID=A0ABQ9HSB0_9NEOP|nr:hypothetical protein PR048_013481 [Dryococelus australis]
MVNHATFKYRLRGKFSNEVQQYDVFQKKFLSIHGVGKRRVERLSNSLKSTRFSPKSIQGKHNNRPHREQSLWIERFKMSNLNQNFSVKKMVDLKKHEGVKVSYDKYNKVFLKEFNIIFGYPKGDTCSKCDEFDSKLKCIQAEKTNVPSCKEEIERKIEQLKTKNTQHKKQAEAFYSRKKIMSKE